MTHSESSHSDLFSFRADFVSFKIVFEYILPIKLSRYFEELFVDLASIQTFNLLIESKRVVEAITDESLPF
jgi:hypothetical protein